MWIFIQRIFSLSFELYSHAQPSPLCSAAWVRGLPGLNWAYMFVGQTHRRRERLKERIKWRHVPVQSNMPGYPKPEAEGIPRAERRSGLHPGPGKTHQANVHGDRASTVPPCDAVDGKQAQQRGGAQTAGGVSKLPLAVAARHSEESDKHGLQVTSTCVFVCWGCFLTTPRLAPSS